MPPPFALHRRFLSWDQMWLPQAVAWLAGDWRGPQPLDLSRVLAIVPTRQSGRRLREALAAHAGEHHAAVFSPRVLTPEALTQENLGEEVASPLETLLAWTEVLREIDLAAFREVFPLDPPTRNFTWALRVAQTFVRLQAALAEAQLRLCDVATKMGEDFVEAGRWQEIAALDRQHAEKLASRGQREPHSARLAEITRPLSGSAVDRIVLLAVPDPPPLALARLSALAASHPIEIVVFAPPDQADFFDEWGRPHAASWEKRPIDCGEIESRTHLCANPAEQAARLAALTQKYDARDGVLAFGLADAEITPLVESALSRLGRPVFNPEGQPFQRGPLHQLLSCLAALARDPGFDAVQNLARCPDFFRSLAANAHGDFSIARWLESLDDLRAEHLPGSLDAAREFAAQDRAPAELGHGLEAMHQLRVVLNHGGFAPAVRGALQMIFAGRHFDLSQEDEARLHESAVAWLELLRECEAAESANLIPSEWWDLALRLFGEKKSEPADKSAAALDLQGWLEVLWEDAPHLVVAGCNDGHVPESVPEDAFLPGALRERLGLETNIRRFARDAYILQAIAACRREHGRLDLVFGKTTAAGEPLRPSRLLLRCPDEELPRRIAWLFRAVEPANASSAWTRAWQLTPRAVPPPDRIAVTALRRYLECPFRFYLRSVLRMDSVDPLKSELDAFDFGTLCHAALEQIGRDADLRECADPVQLKAALLHELDRRVAARYGDLIALPLIIQVESARQRLGKLAELEAAERAAGWTTLHVERAFEIDIAGLLVRGKIDRIDRHTVTGAVRVLDYKTSDRPVTPAEAHLRVVRPGEAVPDWARFELNGKTHTWMDLQLPLYLRALAAEFPGPITCGYFNLPKAAGETTLSLWHDYTRELSAAAERCAAGACAAIRRGEFWPPNENLAAARDECAALFHHGVEESVRWPAA